MKAFVIKNKDGKYFVNFNIWAKSITNVYIETDKEVLENLIEMHPDFLNDCEVVKTTIAEGDLEQQLAEKDEEIKSLENQLDICQVGHKIANQYSQEIFEKYQQKLQELEPQIRKQVCDEIREKADKRNSLYKDNSLAYVINEKILDKIEKGE